MITMRKKSRLTAALVFGRFVLNPISTGEHIYHHYGKFAGIGDKLVHGIGPEIATEIFSNYDTFKGSTFFVWAPDDTAHGRIRTNYFFSVEDKYRYYQKQFRPFYKRPVVDDTLPAISRAAADEIENWPRDETIDFVPFIKKMARRMSLVSLFKEDENPAAVYASNEMSKLGDLGHFSWRNRTPMPYPGSHYKKMLAQAEVTERAVVDWAKTRQGLCPEQDIMSMIVNNPDERGCPASDGRIAAYVLNIFGASYETTSSILSSSCAILARFPDAGLRIREELKSIGWSKDDDPQIAMNLPYLDWFAHEALRLMPPGPIQRRKAAHDTQILGHPIQKDCAIFFSTWQSHRLEEVYPNATKFDPERWDGLNKSPFEFLSFSAGPRRCSGLHFGMAYLKLALAHFVLAGDIVADKGSRFDMAFKITMMPKNQLNLKLTKPSPTGRKPSIIGGDFARAME